MSLASKLESLNRVELAALIFFFAAGVILLVSLPLTDYSPQVALLAILSIIAGYGMMTKTNWAPWLIFVLFLGALTFSIYTLVFAGFSNLLLGISLVVYAILTTVFTVYILVIKRRPL